MGTYRLFGVMILVLSVWVCIAIITTTNSTNLCEQICDDKLSIGYMLERKGWFQDDLCICFYEVGSRAQLIDNYFK